jgi:ribosomal protein S18 acetylase RimI-like enzyme
MDLSLRPAGPEAAEFLYSLMAEAIREYVTAIWGWDESFQRTQFTDRLNPSAGQSLSVHGHAVVSVERRPDEIFLSNLYIMPSRQNHGLGTSLIRGLIAEADERGVPITLYVLIVNSRARALYERLGCTLCCEEH